ncbi:MAG: hypothetical protein JWM16_5801 [Verrucomicrobiales bacterium]|nr:hypothetical protein [Verrucomicrobiales bacterium]
MRMIKWILLITSFVVLGAALLQWQRAAGLNVLNEKLRADSTESTEAAPDTRSSEEEKARLKEEARDLLKLRNEVTQLRKQAKDLPGLRAENERLQKAIQGTSQTSVPVPAPEGFTSREALANMGTATPEAAVQTYFWAMGEQNVQSYLQTVTPHFLEQHAKNIPPEQMEQFNQRLQSAMQEQMKGFSNFRIVGQEQQRNMVIVKLQSSVSSKTAQIGVKLYGNEWRVEGPFF